MFCHPRVSGICNLKRPIKSGLKASYVMEKSSNLMYYPSQPNPHLPIYRVSTTLLFTLFEKSNFCPKIQFWQKPTFSRVFHPNKKSKISYSAVCFVVIYANQKIMIWSYFYSCGFGKCTETRLLQFNANRFNHSRCGNSRPPHRIRILSKTDNNLQSDHIWWWKT